MRRKFVRGQFKDADDARRTIWELEDNAFLGELQKTGKIKNGGEDGRVDE